MLVIGTSWLRSNVIRAGAAIVLGGLLVTGGLIAAIDVASAQRADQEPAPDVAEPPAPHVAKKRPPLKATPPKKAQKVATPAVAPTPANASATPGNFDAASKLKAVGAGTCAAQLNAAASATMGNVTEANMVSNWPTTAIDRRIASVSIGQKYPAGAVVPYAATTIVAAPNPVGACDAVAVQVVPSPLPCDTVRSNMAATSKLIGDLAGVKVMQGAADGETMLVPTSSNSCVLVGVRTGFSK